MASETMTVQEAIELCEPNDARASAEQWLTAMAVLVAHARATTAGTGAGGGRVTVSDAMVEAAPRQSVVDAVRNLVRAQDNLSKAEIDNAHGELSDDEYRKAADAYCAADDVFGATLTAALAPQGVTVTEAMVEVACAAFSREWYEDVEARPMRVALTAALRAAGVADAEG